MSENVPQTPPPSTGLKPAAIVGILLLLAVVMFVAQRNGSRCSCLPFFGSNDETGKATAPARQAGESAKETERSVSASERARSGRPKLLDLGADKCIPCKMMAPILEELKEEYAGRLDVEFIDVWKNPQAARRYGIESIPTQIFFDAEGNELDRHAGFISKEDILRKWRELGIEL